MFLGAARGSVTRRRGESGMRCSVRCRLEQAVIRTDADDRRIFPVVGPSEGLQLEPFFLQDFH